MKPTFGLMAIACWVLASCNMPQRQVPETPPLTETVEAPEPPVSGVPTLEPTLATLQLAVHPPEKRTGIEELDLIIDTVLAHDFERLKTMTSYLTIGCTHADGLGGPPKCTDGEAEGTVVEVVPFLGPEGHHQRRQQYERWQGPDVLGLLAVYRVSSNVYSDGPYPTGDYALVFLEVERMIPVTLQITDGRIIRLDYLVGRSIEEDLRLAAAEIIVPFTINPIPTQVPWTLFEQQQGRFSFVYPPTMTLTSGDQEGEWRIGDRIEFFFRPPGASYVACFGQALGDCPVVQEDNRVQVNGMDARRVKGYFGSVGGMIPQEFLTYIFDVDGDQLVFTLYALPFDAELKDITKIWPLNAMELELFERTVNTLTLP